jgi:hypothetical protein
VESVEGPVCAHCRAHGETVRCAYGGENVWLHRDCVSAFMAAPSPERRDSGLDIPDFLDRRQVGAVVETGGVG